MSMIGKMMLKAVSAKVKARKAAAEANLQVLLQQPVGIGEHTDLVHEVGAFIAEIADAEDELGVLEKYLDQNPERIDG